MTTQNFCYFLQGFLELGSPETISPENLKMIKGHLSLAFRDDIDPSMGGAKHQEILNKLHNTNLSDFTSNQSENPSKKEPLERC